MKVVILLVASMILGACSTSSGFNRGELRSEISTPVQITEESIKKALEAKPQLPEPFKLGIYFEPPKQPEYYYSYRPNWEWRIEDKKLIESAAEELIKSGAISEIAILNSSIVEGEGNAAIRLAAARSGVDAVIIVSGVSDVDHYNNVLGVTYILIVTGAFIPGTVLDGLFMVNASMWDVRNEFLYMSAEAESMASETRPAFFIEEERVIENAKKSALVALKEELQSQFKGLGK